MLCFFSLSPRVLRFFLSFVLESCGFFYPLSQSPAVFSNLSPKVLRFFLATAWECCGFCLATLPKSCGFYGIPSSNYPTFFHFVESCGVIESSEKQKKAEQHSIPNLGLGIQRNLNSTAQSQGFGYEENQPPKKGNLSQ